MEEARTGVRFAGAEEPGDDCHRIQGTDLSGILVAARSPTRSARWPASTRRAATAGEVDAPVNGAGAALGAARADLDAARALEAQVAAEAAGEGPRFPRREAHGAPQGAARG